MNLLSSISLGEAGTLGALGYAIVFLGLIALMLVITVIGKFFSKKKAAPVSQPAPAAAPAPAVAVTVEAVPGTAAPGSAGRLKIHDVPPKTAAMLMAIVANQMGKPLNELRFISITEVK